MTVTNTTPRADYVGNGSVSAYDFDFPVASTSELSVYTTDTAGAVTPLYLSTGFTAVLNADGSGTITLVAGNLTVDYLLAIVRASVLDQQTDFTARTVVTTANAQTSADRLARQVQEVNEKHKGSIRIHPSENPDDFDMVLPPLADRALRTLGFDSDGNVMAGVSAGDASVSAFGETLIDDADAATARVTLGGVTISVDTIAAMTALTGDDRVGTIIVRGRTTKGDGGGGEFYWDAASVATANGSTIIASDAGGVGRFIRLERFGNNVFFTDDYASFNAAITAIGATPARLFVASATALTGIVTVPATCELHFERGGVLTTTGYTLTIASGFEHPARQIFNGTGSVVFSTRPIGSVFPEWWGAVGDGSTDSTAALLKARAAIETTGGEIVISAGTFLLNDDMALYDDATVRFIGWIKRSGTAGTYDAVLTGIPGARNICIINPQIDCDNQAGMNGIIFRRNNHNWRVMGGWIKNCAHDKGGKLGGRAINIEAGVTTSTDPKTSSIVGTNITDCYSALSLSGGDLQEDAICAISNITAKNCQHLIQLFGNAAGYPHDGDSMSYVVSNVIAINCGISTTYTPKHGLINSDRGANVLISNLYCFNTVAYGEIGCLLLGDFKNVHIKNMVFDGSSESIFQGFGYQESDSLVDAGYVSSQNDWQIQHNGVIDDVCVLSSSTASRFISSRMDIVVGTITNDRAVTTQFAAMTGVVYTLREIANDVTFRGRAGQMTTGFTLSSTTPLDDMKFGGYQLFDSNGVVYTLTVSTAGKLLINGTIVGTQT